MNDRFWQKVDKRGDGCWIWTAYKNHGYGRLVWKGRRVLAHRLTYEATHGPVPDGLEIDHLCRNRACVNPAHMEPVTHADCGRQSARHQATARVLDVQA